MLNKSRCYQLAPELQWSLTEAAKTAFKPGYWGGRRHMTSFSKAAKLCSTCAFWAGSRKIKPDGYVEIHPYSKGSCKGGGFKYASMAAMATCNKWELWPLISTDTTDQPINELNPRGL